MATHALLATAIDIDHMANMGWGQMIFWAVVILALAGGVIIAAVTRSDMRQTQNPYDSGLQVLSELYAKGEIDDDEYRRRRQTIEE